jgi:hypothetical protein
MKAFPSNEPIYENNVIGVKQNSGMDLRDYFAALAMQSIIIYDEGDFHLPSIAKESYRMANAMMEARK